MGNIPASELLAIIVIVTGMFNAAVWIGTILNRVRRVEDITKDHDRRLDENVERIKDLELRKRP